MTLQDEIRQEIQQEIFDEFGKTVSLIKQSSPQHNSRGELEGYTEVVSSIVSVPYNIIWDRKSTQPFGELKEGDMALLIPYTVTIAKDDLIEIESERFRVVEIAKHFAPDNVGTICQLRRIEFVSTDDIVPPGD